MLGANKFLCLSIIWHDYRNSPVLKHSLRLRLKDLVRLMGGLVWLEFRRLARPDGWEVEVEGGPQGRTRDDGALPVFS